MPLHFDSITNDSQDTRLIAWIFTTQINRAERVEASADAKFLHLYKSFQDEKTGEVLGRYVFTVVVNDKALNILDADIVFDNPQNVDVFFWDMRNGSSDSNEYYEAVLSDEGFHFQLETVGRHIIEGNITGTVQKVSLCAFPFQLTIYETMEELNSAFGLREPIKVGNTDYIVNGISEKFISPGGVIGDETGETYSFIVGDIIDFRDVTINMGEVDLSFVLTHIDTALGTIPVPMGREVFDLSKLNKGVYVAMKADVKAEFER